MPHLILAHQLWSMKPQEFNNWRADNDLPILFQYFRTTLPEFDVWLMTLNISERDMYLTLNLGLFFNGNGERLVIRHCDSNGVDQKYCIEEKDLNSARWKNISHGHFERSSAIISNFTPYFKWIKKRLKKNEPIMWDKLNSSYTDHFFFGGYSNVRPNSRAEIWRGPQLLKLGEFPLPVYTNLADRNLDFLDLDGLNLSHHYDSAWKIISCSSLRYLSIVDNQAFFQFSYCKFEKTEISDCNIQDFHFYDCNIGEFFVSNSTINRLTFSRCAVLPFIENCHLRDFIKFSPSRKGIQAEETYRLLKNAYNSDGQKKYAAEFFYREQISHRKRLFSAVRDHKYKDDYPNQWVAPWSRILKKINTRSGLKEAISKLLYLLEFIKRPKYLCNYFRHKIQWFFSIFDWLVWGYGVRPYRIAISSSVIILVYAAAYMQFGKSIHSNIAIKSFFDYIYFSIITFTTLGYGDVYPETTLTRILCGSEAFLGAFMMGLVVAGFSNRKAD